MKTAHTSDCKRVFSRYDHTCPRCQELAAGSPARKGWGDVRKRQDEQRRADIRAHFAPGSPHSRGECGPVCTAFDW